MDLFEPAELDLLEEAAVEVGEAPHRTAGRRHHGDVGRVVGGGDGEGDDAGARRHGVLTAGVGAAEIETADVAGDHAHRAVDADMADARRPLVVVLEEEPLAGGVPARLLDVAVERLGERSRAAAVAVHEVEAGHLVTLAAIVEAGVGDQPAVRGDACVVVGATPVGQRPHRAAGRRHRVDLAVERVVLGIVVAVGREDQRPAIRCPVEAAAVVDVAGGQLSRRAAVGGQDEEVRAPAGEVAAAVEAVDEVVDDLEVRPPVGPLGGPRELGDGRLRRVRHEHGEGDRAAVRRPGKLARRVLERRQARADAGREVERTDLGGAVLGVGRVEQARAVGRPARRARVDLRLGQRPQPRAVGADDPERVPLAVGHLVEGAAHEDHLPAVGRDLRVLRRLQGEDVREGEAARRAGVGGSWSRGRRRRDGREHCRRGARRQGQEGETARQQGVGAARQQTVAHGRRTSSMVIRGAVETSTRRHGRADRGAGGERAVAERDVAEDRHREPAPPLRGQERRGRRRVRRRRAAGPAQRTWIRGAYHPRVQRPRLGKLGILWTLYFVQGLPFGFQATALPVYLRTAGMSLQGIGLAAALSLPWSLKILWAPLVDRYGGGRFGRRKSWILPLQLLLALTCAAAALVPPKEGLTPILLLVLGMNLFAATMDIAVDGLAVDVLALEELGQGNVAQVVGYKVGMLTGGGLLVWASGTIGWEGLFAAMTGLIAACFLVTVGWRETDQTRRREPASPLVHPRFGEIVTALRRGVGGTGGGWLLLFIVTYKLGETMADTMFKPFLVDAGYGSTQIGLWVGTWGMLFSIAGSLAGGWLATRRPLLQAVGIAAVLRAIPIAGEWWLTLVTPTPQRVVAITCLEHFFAGALTTAMFAFMMWRVDKRIGATHYTLLAAIEVWGKLGAASISGFVTAHTSYPFLFGLATLLSVAFIGVLGPVGAAARRGQAQAASRTAV